MRTEPVKYSAGPVPDGREPFRLMSIVTLSSIDQQRHRRRFGNAIPVYSSVSVRR
jgi:hypothetical protein